MSGVLRISAQKEQDPINRIFFTAVALTLSGVTKLVTFEVEGSLAPTRMGDKPILGFAATGTIQRSDFNFASKYPTLILGDEIKFTIDAEADNVPKPL